MNTTHHTVHDQILLALVRHSLDIVSIISPEGAFRYVSPSISQILGCPAETYLGQNSTLWVHPDDLSGTGETIRWVMAHPGQPVSAQLRCRHADGRWIPFESRLVNLIEDPVVGGIVIYSRDISERLEQERLLQVAYEGLEQQVQSRTADVRRQSEALLKLSLSRSILERDLSSTIQRITEAGASALEVGRVSLWLYSDSRDRIRCHDLFSRGTGLHAGGEERLVDPRVHDFNRLDTERFVIFEDVYLHPRARPFVEGYFAPNQIRSLLFSHLMIEGRCIGYILFEHLQHPRRWTIDEQNFAASLADLASAAVIAHRHALTDEALRESEERFRAIFEESGLGIVLGGLDGKIIRANRAFQEITGYAEPELMQMHFAQFTHPDDLRQELPLFEAAASSREESRYSFQKRYIRKDGSTIWVKLTASGILQEGGKPRFFIGLVEDITRQKEAQERLLAYQEQLRALTTELSKVEERERRRIAGELHDRIGQCLALIKMRLAGLGEMPPGEKEPDNFRQIGELLDQAIADTRSLIFELSPPVLHLLGFEAALAWLADHTFAQHGLKVRLSSDHEDKPLDEETRDLLFQSVREILFNVVKHARARQVLIDIRRQDGWIVVAVEDDGVGFVPELSTRETWPDGGFGLFHIRERLSQVKGWLEIQSAGEAGSIVRLHVPLETEAKPVRPASPAEVRP